MTAATALETNIPASSSNNLLQILLNTVLKTNSIVVAGVVATDKL
jgi:hypothetical protein